MRTKVHYVFLKEISICVKFIFKYGSLSTLSWFPGISIETFVQIILVGGGSRVPKVQELLSDFTKKVLREFFHLLLPSSNHTLISVKAFKVSLSIYPSTFPSSLKEKASIQTPHYPSTIVLSIYLCLNASRSWARTSIQTSQLPWAPSIEPQTLALASKSRSSSQRWLIDNKDTVETWIYITLAVRPFCVSVPMYIRMSGMTVSLLSTYCS